jgi:PAS domain S-box-containing protein
LQTTGTQNDPRVNEDVAATRRSVLRSSVLPLLVLLVSLGATTVTWYGLKAQAEASAAADFDTEAREIAATVEGRTRGYQESLQAVVALFATSRVITRDDWRRFVDGLELRRDHPGVWMLGFAKQLDPHELPAHEQQMRTQDAPDYHVWPAGQRDQYVAVTFIEPFSGNTRRLLGYDMLADPISRTAMQRARDSGIVSLSQRWSPAVGGGSAAPATVLMFAPLYTPEHPQAGGDRASASVGYVYAALHCDDFMADVLRNSVVDVGLAVYDGKETSPGSLLYENARARDVMTGQSKPAFQTTLPVTVAGHEWTLRLFSESYDQAVPQRQLPLLALAAGIPLSFLLFGIAWSQATLRARAVRIAQDMTQSLRSQAGLLDLTHDAVFLRDRHNVIRYWNRAASDTYGFSAEEAVGRTVDDLLHTKLPLPPEELWHELESTDRWEGELVHTRRDGSEIIVASRWAVQRDAHGAIEAILETNNDVTEHRREQEERRRLEASLMQASKLEALGTLAGGIAHDFNNILGAILGYGELAQNEAAQGSSLRRYVDSVMGAGQRARSLVARILAFSRSGLGQRLAVHVQSVVAEALDLLSTSLPDDVRLERNLSAGDAAVIGDPTQIHQVVLNLGTNAIHAMKTGGTLTVRLDTTTIAAPVTLVTGTINRGEYVRLAVSDTGLGIEPSLRDRIFDPFFTTKGVGVGTGLGLSLVHGIAADLGGGVNVQSEPGRGTTFEVYLPCSGRVTRVDPEREALPLGNGETVMLVDDEEVLVRLGEEMIARLGYEPVGYTSSTEALQAFRADPQRFDVVLSDETMPGMTGSQLVERIRAIRPDIPILLMSGFAAAPLAARAAAVGASEVLNKPLVARDMARSLEAALRRRVARSNFN